jgi:hypothetical protein
MTWCFDDCVPATGLPSLQQLSNARSPSHALSCSATALPEPGTENVGRHHRLWRVSARAGWSIRFVSFIWLNQTNLSNQKKQLGSGIESQRALCGTETVEGAASMPDLTTSAQSVCPRHG